jgi:valyl-tRNA synthetase
MMNGATVKGELPELASLNAIDKWILSRLSETISEVDSLLEQYEFARACELMYHFAWDDLCDWYLELSKESFSSGDAESTKRVLGFVLDQLFRLMHPIMPFITETMWTALTGGESLVIAEWPVAKADHVDKKAEKLIGELQEIITDVRRFRNDQGIKTSQKIPARFIAPAHINEYAGAMAFVLRLELGEIVPSAHCEIGSVKVEFDLTGSIDVVAERARLEKDLATAQKDKQTAEVKLNNQGFMAKAPDVVVVEIRDRLEKTSADIERITAQLAQLPRS